MRLKILILSLLCGFAWSLGAQTDVVAQDSASKQAAQESLEIYRIMAEKSPAAFEKYVKEGEELLKDIQRMKESSE